MDNERFLWLVMKSFTGEISPEEKKELDEFLAFSSFYSEKYKLLKGFWSQEVFYNHSADTNAALQKVLSKINGGEELESLQESSSRVSWFKRYAVAAILLLAVGLGIFTYMEKFRGNKQIELVEKYNGNGAKSMITLTDGTRIWLNSESKIKYPKSFQDDERTVYLTGEAFFKVAPDPEKPFYIHLNKAKIRVIGTSFNVKAYEEDDHVETSVVSGKVAFIPNLHKAEGPDTVFLTRNNKVTYTNSSGDIITEITNTNDDKEWINGKLIFKSESLESISRQLERNFGKKILFKDNKLKQYKFTGSFDESSLNEILYYLSLSKPFKYTSTDSTLIIY
jgi:transmembrane sensor